MKPTRCSTSCDYMYSSGRLQTLGERSHGHCDAGDTCQLFPPPNTPHFPCGTTSPNPSKWNLCCHLMKCLEGHCDQATAAEACVIFSRGLGWFIGMLYKRRPQCVSVNWDIMPLGLALLMVKCQCNLPLWFKHCHFFVHDIIQWTPVLVHVWSYL